MKNNDFLLFVIDASRERRTNCTKHNAQTTFGYFVSSCDFETRAHFLRTQNPKMTAWHWGVKITCGKARIFDASRKRRTKCTKHRARTTFGYFVSSCNFENRALFLRTQIPKLTAWHWGEKITSLGGVEGMYINKE